MKNNIVLVGAAVALALTACGSSQQNSIMLKVNATKPGARIKIAADNEKALIEIFSPSGIGSANLAMTSATLPKKIVLRFHLRGLEELRFSYDETIITTSLASTNAPQIRQSLSRIGEKPATETALAPDSPYWMKLRLVSSDSARNAIPLQNGYIEIEAPEHFLKGGYRQATLQWIDFYR